MKEFWEKYKAELGLAVLIIYTLSLGVATADELFHLGLFPTKLDRMIAQAIEKFESQDPREREQGVKEIIEYGDFAVPQLIKALDEPGQARTLALRCLKKISGLDFEDPEKWKEWYKQHREEF